ncbi:MAG: zinc ribbon domain-containing protein [Syntrophaceae bacterium]|nr:zinc ribbon domain-containing protein [Syntrophaceae bacterium]
MQEALKINIQQIMGFIKETGLMPSALSPFYSEKPAANQDSKLNSAYIPLVKVVCEPSAVISGRVISAQGDVVTRIYADRSGRMTVRHWLDKDGLHNFRQVQEKEIATEAALRLMLDIPPSRLDFDTELTEESFCALLGLIDGWREKTLSSLIDRKPGGKFSFTVEYLYTAFRRSISSNDFRWLTPLVKELYPGNLEVSSAAFKEGLQNIFPKFAQADAQEIQLSPVGEELCSMLGAPLAAIKLTVYGIKNGAIFEENIMGLRGMGIYCTVESAGEGHRKISLKNSSAPMIEFYIHSALKEAFKASTEAEAQRSVKDSAQTVAASSESVTARDQELSKKFCSECGKPLKPGAKFCAGCGAKI